VRDLGFRPSTHGFAFANRWPPGPAFEWHRGYIHLGIGQVGNGLCGGMAFAAGDRFMRGETIQADPEVPPAGSALFDEIARRQLDSFELGLVPLRFWLAAARLRSGRWTERRQVREWRSIRRALDGGAPAMVGLVRSPSIDPFSLTANHQVLGYGYDASADAATISIYDPNHPGDDDVRLRLDRRDGRLSLAQSTGEPLLALLSLPYRPAAG
jgi:hypothetical protein